MSEQIKARVRRVCSGAERGLISIDVVASSLEEFGGFGGCQQPLESLWSPRLASGALADFRSDDCNRKASRYDDPGLVGADSPRVAAASLNSHPCLLGFKDHEATLRSFIVNFYSVINSSII